MSEKITPKLSGVPETLLITLYVRARESQRPDAMMKDAPAVAMVNRIEYDFSRLKMQRHDEVAVIMRMNKFDNHARDLITRNPQAVIVHIGCGFDTRFERVAERDDSVQWFDLDLPAVMDVRRQLIGTDSPRYHMLAASVFDKGWLDELGPYQARPFLFLAEGVFPYFEEAQIKSLFLRLRSRFPGAELVCDAHTPFVIWADNLQLALAGVEARLHWRLKHSRDVERWGEGIRLLEEWNYFQEDEPRLKWVRWVRLVPPLASSSGIFHYKLG